MADLTSIIGLGLGIPFGITGLVTYFKGKQLADSAKASSETSTKDKEKEEAKLRELEQKFAQKETDASRFRQELEETGRRLKEAEQRSEGLTKDLAKQTALIASLETAQKALEEEKAALEAAKSTVAVVDVAALEARLADAEARAATAEAELLTADEGAEKRLAKLSQMSEKLAYELKEAKEKLSALEAGGAVSSGKAPLAGADIFLNTLVESSHDAIAVLDGKGNVISWNRASETIFGYVGPEAQGLKAELLIATDSRGSFQKSVEMIDPSGTGKPRTLDVYGMRKDGSVFPMQVVLAGWKDADGETRYVLAAHDATERLQAEAMRRDKEAAEEANRSKSQFLANMSHELRTPLNAIIGFSEILHDRTFGELTPKQDRYVGNILSSGRHLLQLINDILDLSKIEAGRMQVEYAAFSPLTAVRTVDNLVKALLQKKNITLEVDAGANLPPLIADQSKFKQILYNLISNAIKFTPEGGKVFVTIKTAGNGSLLQIDVKDTGIGIKKEDQARIFREFEQVDSSYSRQQQGTGLGLALVTKFVQMHNGRIWCESEGEGQGSTFSFTVPFAPGEESSSTERAAKPAPVAVSNAPKTVALVVDDDPAASELLTHHLQEGGYDVARAASGADAIQLAKKLKPGVITLDVELPDTTGWEVLQALKADEETRSIPVVVISVTTERSRAQDLGASECLEKPVERQSLLQTLADVRERQALRTESEQKEGSLPGRRRGRSERAAA